MGFSARFGFLKAGGMLLSAPKGRKCYCGKRAKGTLMSPRGGGHEVYAKRAGAGARGYVVIVDHILPALLPKLFPREASGREAAQ